MPVHRDESLEISQRCRELTAKFSGYAGYLYSEVALIGKNHHGRDGDPIHIGYQV
jgi:hypothetical protein